MRYNQTRRPKWALALTAEQWKHLQRVQGKSRPTLAELKQSVRVGQATGYRCLECLWALRAVESGGNEGQVPA